MVDTLAGSAENIDVGLTGLSKRARVWLLTVASVDVLMVITSMVALNAALPDIALETSATQGQLTWVVDGYTLVLACLLLPAGAIGDRYGRRGALLAGLGIFALASLAPVFFHSPLQIIVARAVAGIGAAFIMPATLSLLTAAFPRSERNKAVGIWAGVASSGAVFGFWAPGSCCISGPGSRSSWPSRSPVWVCSSSRARSRLHATKPPHPSIGSAPCSSAPPLPCSCSASSRRRQAGGPAHLS